MYEEYSRYTKISLDDYCERYGISDEDKKVLQLMEEVDRLKKEKDNELRKILNANKSGGRNK